MFLYTKGKDEHITVPARQIEDIELPESAFKPDFELAARYQDFLKELVRFSLLGVAGYGFLIKQVLGEKNEGIITSGPKFALMVTSLLCLACSVACGLYCGELNKACLRMQVSILRLLQRLGSERWTDPTRSSPDCVEEWRKENTHDLQRLRNCQLWSLGRARILLRLTVWSLLLGIALTAVVFIMCLKSTTAP